MDLQLPGYSIKKTLGKGGMAVVYLAHHHKMHRDVAIKVLTPTVAAEQSYAQRFLQEARTVATLNHPHIIPVYDVGQVQEHSYIVMEYLPALALSHWIEVGLEPQEALTVVEQVASALYYSHGKGVIHRDIKPDNIMFREDGSAVLMDFGIACSSKADKNLTQEGQMIGTPAYMSPEQARGQSIDGRSDLYALGVVFYEMLSKKQPYDGEDAIAIALKHVTEPVPVLASSFSHYQFLLNKMMAKAVDDRYQNALALVKAVKLTPINGAQAEHAKPALNVVPESSLDQPAISPVTPEPQNAAEVLTANSLSLTAASDEIIIKNGKNLEVDVVSTTKALFFKRSMISIKLISDDLPQFNVQIGQVGERLIEWHAQHGRKAKQVELNFYCKPWLREPIEKTLKKMLASREPYGFLCKMSVTVKISDLAGNLLLEEDDFLAA